MMMHPDDCDCKRCTGRLRPPADRITSKAALSAGNAGRGVMDPNARPNKCPHCDVHARTIAGLNTHIEVCHPGQRKVSAGKPKRRPTQGDIRKALRPKEGNISKSIESQLNGFGIWNSRIQSVKVKLANGGYLQGARPGTPDRIAAAGLHVWIEVKRSGEVGRPDQLATIEQLKANGALAFVLDDPHDLDFVLEYLKTYGPQIRIINAEIDRIQRTIDHAIANARAARAAKGNK